MSGVKRVSADIKYDVIDFKRPAQATNAMLAFENCPASVEMISYSKPCFTVATLSTPKTSSVATNYGTTQA